MLFSDASTDEKLAVASLEMKKAMAEIPYLGAVVKGGELAKLAFDYMKENAPMGFKKNISGAFATAIGGRFKAFQGWLKQAWSGVTGLETVLGDYEDYLALFPAKSHKKKVSLHGYFDATRAPGDRGNYNQYQKVINRMGLTAEKSHYVTIRAEARNSELKKQYATTVARINILEG